MTNPSVGGGSATNSKYKIIQIHHNRIKTPTGRRKPVGYLQAWPRIRTPDDIEQIQQVARAGLETGTTTLQVRTLTTRPHCLPCHLTHPEHTSGKNLCQSCPANDEQTNKEPIAQVSKPPNTSDHHWCSRKDQTMAQY